MFVGHYGASFAAKSIDTKIPLWLLFLATQLVDVLWAIFVFLGVERVNIVEGFTSANHLHLEYMPYTHALTSSVGWAVLAAGAYAVLSKKRWGGSAIVVGAAVLSHWVFDWPMHVPDLPLYGNELKQGLGLWREPVVVTFAIEGLVLFGGLLLYLRATKPTNGGRYGTLVYVVVMFAAFVGFTFGPPPPSDKAVAAMALVSYLAFAGVAYWLERKRE